MTQNSNGKAANNKRAPYAPSDMPIGPDGTVYHLQISPKQLAQNILIVGDPGRARYIGENFLEDLEFENEHRGLVTLTGTSRVSAPPLRVTVVTSGMGTPSLEIVLNELMILNEIDFDTRTRKTNYPMLNIIRVGTSGGLQAETTLGTPIITTYGVGLDNAGLFYEVPYPDETCRRLEAELSEALREEMLPGSRYFGEIHPYVSRANPDIVAALCEASESLGIKTKLGMTVSAPGFSAAQGRDINRIHPSIPDLDLVFSEFNTGVEGQRFENMEMEASFLIHYFSGLGYRAGAICPAIANRRQDTIDIHYQDAITNAIKTALLSLAKIRRRYLEE